MKLSEIIRVLEESESGNVGVAILYPSGPLSRQHRTCTCCDHTAKPHGLLIRIPSEDRAIKQIATLPGTRPPFKPLAWGLQFPLSKKMLPLLPT
jgi:hypothetical protein